MLKSYLQSFLFKRGIEIRKCPDCPCKPFPFLFRLAISQLQHSQDIVRFIQVGANDGVYGDPLRKYIKAFGWEGILIEPQRDVFHRLLLNYKGQDNLIFVNKAIHPSLDSLSMYRVKDVHIDGQMPFELTITSVDSNVVARHSKRSLQELEVISVDAITLNNLISSYQYDSFDLLQIDCEGYDGEVLKSIDLNLYRPKIIQFEHGHMTRLQISEVARLLDSAKYEFFYGGRNCDSLALSSEFAGQL